MIHSWIEPLVLCPAVSIMPSSMMKASQNAGGILTSINLIFPSPMTTVCGVFSNQFLPSSFGLQIKSKGTQMYHFWQILKTSLISHGGAISESGTCHFIWYPMTSARVIILYVG